jgi:hypothetical protein
MLSRFSSCCSLWQPRRRLGAQLTNAPGSWNFSDLHTGDAAGAANFYGPLFGWEFDDGGFATMIRRPGYGDHLAATVDPGIFERQDGISAPPGFADAIGWLAPLANGQDQWHVTFTVQLVGVLAGPSVGESAHPWIASPSKEIPADFNASRTLTTSSFSSHAAIVLL